MVLALALPGLMRYWSWRWPVATRLGVLCLIVVMQLLVGVASVWIRVATANRGSMQRSPELLPQSRSPILRDDSSSDSQQSLHGSKKLLPDASALQSERNAPPPFLSPPSPSAESPHRPSDARECAVDGRLVFDGVFQSKHPASSRSCSWHVILTTTELSDAGGPAGPNWQLTRPARGRSSGVRRFGCCH